MCANSAVPCREFSSKDLRTVGNYTLGRLIGKGSFGKVYLATHKLTNGSKVGLRSEYLGLYTHEDLGRSEVCKQGRFESCARDPPSSTVPTSTYCATIRSHSD